MLQISELKRKNRLVVHIHIYIYAKYLVWNYRFEWWPTITVCFILCVYVFAKWNTFKSK